MYRNVEGGATGEAQDRKSKVYVRVTARPCASCAGHIEFPSGGIVGKILFGPSQHHAGPDGIKHDLRHDHKGHLVLGAGSGVQLHNGGRIADVNFLGTAFENDYIIAGVEMDRYG